MCKDTMTALLKDLRVTPQKKSFNRATEPKYSVFIGLHNNNIILLAGDKLPGQKWYKYYT